MSDFLSAEEMEQLKARDHRFRVIDDGLALAQELRSSLAVRFLLDDLKNDALAAALDLAEVNPADTMAVTKLVARAQGYAYIRTRLDRRLQAAKAAEAVVMAEDTRLDERYDGDSDP